MTVNHLRSGKRTKKKQIHKYYWRVHRTARLACQISWHHTIKHRTWVVKQNKNKTQNQDTGLTNSRQLAMRCFSHLFCVPAMLCAKTDLPISRKTLRRIKKNKLLIYWKQTLLTDGNQASGAINASAKPMQSHTCLPTRALKRVWMGVICSSLTSAYMVVQVLIHIYYVICVYNETK